MDTTNSNDMLNDDWVIPCLDGTTDDMKQPQAFDQASKVNMRPPQLMQI